MKPFRPLLEIEFRLLENLIIKKRLKSFRNRHPEINVPRYQEEIDRQIRREETFELLSKIIYYSGIIFLILTFLSVFIILVFFKENPALINLFNNIYDYFEKFTIF